MNYADFLAFIESCTPSGASFLHAIEEAQFVYNGNFPLMHLLPVPSKGEWISSGAQRQRTYKASLLFSQIDSADIAVINTKNEPTQLPQKDKILSLDALIDLFLTAINDNDTVSLLSDDVTYFPRYKNAGGKILVVALLQVEIKTQPYNICS